jgi:hypothetical protein
MMPLDTIDTVRNKTFEVLQSRVKHYKYVFPLYQTCDIETQMGVQS